MKTLEIGIAGYDQMKSRSLAIARGEHTPAKGEPKVWFTSIESFAKLLSEHCQWASKMSGYWALKMSGSERCSAEGAERPERGSGPVARSS